MGPRVVPFVDHEVGFRLLGRMIELRDAGRLDLPRVVTTVENGTAWWPAVAPLCAAAGIPLDRYSHDLDPAADEPRADWFLLLSWKHLLPAPLLARPRYGTINLHYSLLPELRGVYPVNWALIEGRGTTGVTFHRVTAQIDAGPAVLQQAMPIRATDTARTLQLRLDDLAVAMFDDLLARLPALQCAGDEARGESSAAPAASYRSRQDFDARRKIDLQRTYRASELIDLMRGMTFLPGSRNAYFIDPATGRRVYVSISLAEESADEGSDGSQGRMR